MSAKERSPKRSQPPYIVIWKLLSSGADETTVQNALRSLGMSPPVVTLYQVADSAHEAESSVRAFARSMRSRAPGMVVEVATRDTDF